MGFLLPHTQRTGDTAVHTNVSYFTSQYEKNLFHERYQDPGNRDREKSWEDVFARVANTVSPDEDLALRFYSMMSNGSVIPSSPQLWNYGAERRFPRNGSSCFTGMMGDTLKEFRQADSDAEDVYVASGGFGLLLDEIRPRATKIKHCSEGAMGSMCEGGPALRIESTTGYITGSGRARGALMLQQSLWHPDVIEFIVAKRPASLGFLDDWRSNAWSKLGWTSESVRKAHVQFAVERFYSKWAFEKEWPTTKEFCDDLETFGYNGDGALSIMWNDGGDNRIVEVVHGRVVPVVTDWSTGDIREANRDWDLPLQNCNMSVRAPDCFYEAVKDDAPWVMHWFSPTPPHDGMSPWTLSDFDGELKEYEDGTVFVVSDDMTEVYRVDTDEYDGVDYRYGQVITTWEGLRARLAPNKNQWRDTKYARFYRTRLLPAIDKYSGTIMARHLWDLLIENAWNHADPGIVNSDTYERFQPVDSAIYGPRLSNPCSEYVNSAGGSCNLASLNLRHAVMTWQGDIDMDLEQWPDGSPDWESVRTSGSFHKFRNKVRYMASDAIEYISHALEYNKAPVKYIDDMTRDHYRTVGVGFMGLAEALISFHIKYGSPCAVNFTASVMSEIALACWERSFDMAMNDGWRKPEGWNRDKMVSIFSKRLKNTQTYSLPPSHAARWRRLVYRAAKGDYATHTCVTSVAPTGTISQIAGWMLSRIASNGVPKTLTVTSGVEPVFAANVGRQDSSGSTTVSHDMWASEEHSGKPWLVTANELPAESHVRMQAAACAFCCMSVSKTINVHKASTRKEIADAYWLAWKLGIPGTSVYRDESKPMQVLSALECPSGECAVEIPDESGITIESMPAMAASK